MISGNIQFFVTYSLHVSFELMHIDESTKGALFYGSAIYKKYYFIDLSKKESYVFGITASVSSATALSLVGA